jgi:hypothetical protein
MVGRESERGGVAELSRVCLVINSYQDIGGCSGYSNQQRDYDYNLDIESKRMVGIRELNAFTFGVILGGLYSQTPEVCHLQSDS